MSFHAYARAYPGLKIGIVALTNSSYPLEDQHPCEAIAHGVLSEFKKALLAPDPFNAEQIDLQRYVGVYALPGAGAEMSIEFQDGRLRVTLLQDRDFCHEINSVEANAFGIDGSPEPWLSFVGDDMKGIRSLRFLGFTFVRNR